MTPPDAPVAAVMERGQGASPYVLLCEHASNLIPVSYRGLGLPEPELRRHIAWDIGAAALARSLSAHLDAPLVLSGYSRLLIDCNRPPGTPTSIPERSEDTVIPGNAGLSRAERANREAAYFAPFRGLVAAELDRRAVLGKPTILVGVHSFTPVFQGVHRPWEAGVLYADGAGFAGAMIAGLAASGGLTVGDNEPYRIEPEHDYTIPMHGDGRGIPAALLEVRQDLLLTDVGIGAWAARVATILSSLTGHARAPQFPTGDHGSANT